MERPKFLVRGHTLIAKHEQSEARGASFAHQLANQLSYGRLSPDHRFVFVITQNRRRYNHRKFWHQRTEKSNLDGDASVRMYYVSRRAAAAGAGSQQKRSPRRGTGFRLPRLAGPAPPSLLRASLP